MCVRVCEIVRECVCVRERERERERERGGGREGGRGGGGCLLCVMRMYIHVCKQVALFDHV